MHVCVYDALCVYIYIVSESSSFQKGNLQVNSLSTHQQVQITPHLWRDQFPAEAKDRFGWKLGRSTLGMKRD